MWLRDVVCCSRAGRRPSERMARHDAGIDDAQAILESSTKFSGFLFTKSKAYF